jgi:hypothetical protein
MSMENRKSEDGTNPENAPEEDLVEDRELDAISGGIVAKVPSPPEI